MNTQTGDAKPSTGVDSMGASRRDPPLRPGRMLVQVAIVLLLGLGLLPAMTCEREATVVQQPDGTEVAALLTCQDFFAIFESVDGYRLIQDPVTRIWSYAQPGPVAGTLVASGLLPGRDQPSGIARHLREGVAERARIIAANQERLHRDHRGRIRFPDEVLAAGKAAAAPPARTTVGDKRGMLLLAQFPDLEGSRIDANPLCFSYDKDLEKNRQGTRSVQVAPGTPVDAMAWLGLIRTQSDHEVARRLGITDRQVRRIKTGKVSEARMREHAKADPEYTKDHCRPCPTWARAAPFLLAVAGDWEDAVCPIAA